MTTQPEPSKWALERAHKWLNHTHGEEECAYFLSPSRCLALEFDAIARERDEAAEKWERALVGLTPGGSEFVGEPENCVRFVRERLETVIQVQKRALAAEKAAENLADALRIITELAERPCVIEVANEALATWKEKLAAFVRLLHVGEMCLRLCHERDAAAIRKLTPADAARELERRELEGVRWIWEQDFADAYNGGYLTERGRELVQKRIASLSKPAPVERSNEND